MATTITKRDASGTDMTVSPAQPVRRVPVLQWNPACGFHMVAQFFTQAAYIMELAQSGGEKISPEEALEASAVQLSCQLELSPECMSRVKAAMREGLRALDSQ